MLGRWANANIVTLSANWVGNEMRASPLVTLLTTTPVVDELGLAGHVGSGSVLSSVVVSAQGMRGCNINGFTGATGGALAVGAQDDLLAFSAEL